MFSLGTNPIFGGAIGSGSVEFSTCAAVVSSVVDIGLVLDDVVGWGIFGVHVVVDALLA